MGADVEAHAQMTRHRFEEFQKCLSFAPLTGPQLSTDVSCVGSVSYLGIFLFFRLWILSFGRYFSQDPWALVRPLIDGFNKNRELGVIPGRHMLMSSWRGAELNYHADRMPNVSKIVRKPEGV
jgi:hypothetical protein